MNEIHNYVEPILRQNKNYFQGTGCSKSRYWIPKLRDDCLIENVKQMKRFLENDLKMIGRLSSKKINMVLELLFLVSPKIRQDKLVSALEIETLAVI